MEKLLDNNYWDKRYDEKQTGWDIGHISEPLKKYIDQLTDRNISILVPGCGNAYEAEYLLELGFTNITLVDISPVLVHTIEKKLGTYQGKQLQLRCADFFDLQLTVDLVIEQTFFCALDPIHRKDYVNKMAEIIKPGGKLVGVLFDRSFEGGPPFGGNKAEYEKLFSKKFKINIMAPCYNSIDSRKGSELFISLTKI